MWTPFFSSPCRSITCLASRAICRGTFDLPVFFYDGDVPASLPNMQGFASGFRIYQGADLSEYSAFISNSSGGADLLKQMGAANAHTLWYGADPDVFRPIPSPAQDIDLFFYGHGREYREEWIDSMITLPARQLPDARFAVRGTNLGELGAVEELPYLSFSKLREYVCRSRINLCITRGAHASVYASSSSRPFELGALGACTVANPYLGIEEWFEPGKEVVIVESAEEAVAAYDYLLRNDGSAATNRQGGSRARFETAHLPASCAGIGRRHWRLFVSRRKTGLHRVHREHRVGAESAEGSHDIRHWGGAAVRLPQWRSV